MITTTRTAAKGTASAIGLKPDNSDFIFDIVADCDWAGLFTALRSPAFRMPKCAIRNSGTASAEAG